MGDKYRLGDPQHSPGMMRPEQVADLALQARDQAFAAVNIVQKQIAPRLDAMDTTTAAVAGALQHRIALLEGRLDLLKDFLEREVFAAVPKMRESWDAAIEDHNLELTIQADLAVAGNYFGPLPRSVIVGWSAERKEPEVFTVNDVDEKTGAAVVYILCDKASPLWDEWDGQVRRGDDLGSVLKPLSAQVVAQKRRLMDSGAYEGLDEHTGRKGNHGGKPVLEVV